MAGGVKPILVEAEIAMTAKEVESLLSVLKDFIKFKLEGAKLIYDIVILMLNSGLRCQEVCDLKKRNLVFDSRPHIAITGKWRKIKKTKEGIRKIAAKNRPVDIVFIPSGFINEAKRMARKAKNKDDLVFLHKDTKLNRLWIWRKIKLAMDRAELNPRYSPHTLRHRFIIETYISSGYDIEFTRRQARHNSIVTTQKYMSIASMLEKADKALKDFNVKL